MKSPWGDSNRFYALWFPVLGLTLMKMVFPTRRKERRLPGILLCGSLFATLLLLPSCGGGSNGRCHRQPWYSSGRVHHHPDRHIRNRAFDDRNTQGAVKQATGLDFGNRITHNEG